MSGHPNRRRAGLAFAVAAAITVTSSVVLSQPVRAAGLTVRIDAPRGSTGAPVSVLGTTCISGSAPVVTVTGPITNPPFPPPSETVAVVVTDGVWVADVDYPTGAATVTASCAGEGSISKVIASTNQPALLATASLFTSRIATVSIPNVVNGGRYVAVTDDQQRVVAEAVATVPSGETLRMRVPSDSGKVWILGDEYWLQEYPRPAVWSVTVPSSSPPESSTWPGYVPVVQARLSDTRPGFPTVDGAFAGVGPVGAGEVLELQVSGRGGVPEAFTGLVALNVTVTAPSSPTFVTVFPSGGAAPGTSNVNVSVPGTTVANLALVRTDAAGRVSLLNGLGSAHLVVDVVGYFESGADAVGPARLLDTRPGFSTVDGAYAGVGAVGANGVLELQVAGRGGVPPGFVGLVALNVTVTGSSSPTFVSVFPTGGPVPGSSNVNVSVAGSTVANLVVVRTNDAGFVSLLNGLGSAHLVVDVLGVFGSSVDAVGPARLLDTRPGFPTVDGFFAGFDPISSSGGRVYLQVSGRAGVPKGFVGTVVLNVAVTGATEPGFLTVSPGEPPPDTSSVGFDVGATLANVVFAQTDHEGRVWISKPLAGDVDIIVDLLALVPGARALYTGSLTDVLAVSSDGSTVVYVEATAGGGELRLLDVATWTTRVVASGQTSPGVYGAMLAADGNALAFMSDWDLLVPGDRNAVSDIFVLDLTSGAVRQVNDNNPAPPPGPGQFNTGARFVEHPAISADGRFVAYTDRDVRGNQATQVLVRDLVTWQLERVDVSSGEVPGTLGSPGARPQLSSDGRLVAFESTSPNLVPNDTNGDPDVFVRDRVAGTTARVSVDSNGQQLDVVDDMERLALASFAPDGSSVAFWSQRAVWRRDLTAGLTVTYEPSANESVQAVGADPMSKVAVVVCPIPSSPAGCDLRVVDDDLDVAVVDTFIPGTFTPENVPVYSQLVWSAAGDVLAYDFRDVFFRAYGLAVIHWPTL